MLNPWQKDALTELVNIYIGRAANLLSEMVNQQIILTIPRADLIEVSDLEPTVREYLPGFSRGHMVSSSIRFGQEFQGKALLIFPAEQAKVLINACLGEEAGNEQKSFPLLDTDLDVLKEIGNVILNSVIGEFGNLLNLKLEYSLPEIEFILITETDQKASHNSIYILVLHTSFELARTHISGAILIALSLNSVALLLSRIDELLEDLDG